MTESIVSVAEALKGSQGPYDGLMCFSQGSSLGAHIAMLQHEGDPRFNFRFYILVGGYLSNRADHRPAFDELLNAGVKISVPSLHVFGETDKVIECWRSREL